MEMKVFKVHYKIMENNTTVMSVTDYSTDLDYLMERVKNHVTQSFKGYKELGKIDVKEIDGIEEALKHVRKDYRKYGTLAVFHGILNVYQEEADEKMKD